MPRPKTVRDTHAIWPYLPSTFFRLSPNSLTFDLSTIWVGTDGYPLRIDVKGDAGGGATSTTIRYSRFNDPSIRIDPPPQ